MNAVIYAAGRATRLGRAHAHRPKILLEFGGRSLLEWHALRLAAVGVDRVFVVTGHAHELVADAIPGIEARTGVTMVELFNPDFCEGSVLSMNVSIPVLAGAREPVLVMDGDVLYDGRMLPRLLESPERTALLVDRSYVAMDDDPVLVPLRGGRPFELLKGWTGEADAVGESVGFFKVDPADLPLLVSETRTRAEGGRRRESLDEVLRAMVVAGRFGAVDISGLPWTEIDFPHDVEYALNTVLPQCEGPVPDPKARG